MFHCYAYYVSLLRRHASSPTIKAIENRSTPYSLPSTREGGGVEWERGFLEVARSRLLVPLTKIKFSPTPNPNPHLGQAEAKRPTIL